ncbi:MAG: hypothetical protein ACR2O0_13020 [Rhizobiaceae bacterium]
MKIRSNPSTVVIIAATLAVSGCTTSDTSGPSSSVFSNNTNQQGADTQPVVAAVNPNCKKELADGPPPKPARGADFGQIAANNNSSDEQGIIQTIGGHFGEQTAATNDSTTSARTNSDVDVRGTWNITDGSPNCVCKLTVDGVFTTQGKGSDTGTIKINECTSPGIISMATWSLAYTSSGYDSKLELKTKDRKTALAILNREGIHYFSGRLSNGAPITMWREGQNYKQLQFGQNQTRTGQ